MNPRLQGISEIPYIFHMHDIEHAVISPGSRNAPLTLAFVSHPNINCISITDERSAAYYALGIAQQLQKPVVLICTSGTALVNFGPAITEAYYLKVPLIILSADRPPEWIDQNDGQTIRQNDFFRNVVKKSFVLPVETENEEDLWHFRRIMNEAIGTCKTDNPGPVHINIPVREPLYSPLPEVAKIPPVISVTSGNYELNAEQWQSIIQKWNACSKKLIVCGFSPVRNLKLEKMLGQLAGENEAVVIAENLSNLYDDNFIDAPDRFIAALDEENREKIQPELLITIGGSIVSKRLKKYLRTFATREHWHVDEYDLHIDTFKSLNLNIRLQPENFFTRLTGQGSANSDYTSLAHSQNIRAKKLHEAFISETDYSDMKACKIIMEQLPPNINLHLANSTPVRYAQLFGSNKYVNYFSNRGTSGIDGCVSTAAGAALVSKRLNILLVGDLGFIYDSNALWYNNLPGNLRIIVLDNGGGNIFKLIETGPEVEKIKPYIETPHNVNIKGLCDAFGVNYMSAANTEELENILPEFFKPNGLPIVLHIRTNGEVSADIFKQYFQNISKKDE
ncbi:MAG: 2-succinyl-5-enolpyruvyl-6-hydroxy-3-cyclohexene-1-carboxylic-acid synthase [Bacteroidetes bacterium]|nr:MAG: 2-succinyl-5-enolpyruvyl-6-hydroxy-3-cyclohexene-1-carboxylic-acid synthase [Bacteroidota bacterium]